MKILYAIDVREEEGWMLDEVGSWAEMLGATVDLVYVDAFGDAGTYVLDGDLYRMLKQELAAEHRRTIAKMEEIVEQLPERNRGKCRVLSGHPVEGVLALADEYDAVAIGTHGRTGLSRALLGSTAERIVRRSPVTTIVLRGNTDTDAA